MPGITRSKLWASSGSDFMPRAANAFFIIGQAMYSVVPGATVVSMSVRQFGWTLSPIVFIVASRAFISAVPVRILPSSLCCNRTGRRRRRNRQVRGNRCYMSR